ncbi:MAG: protein-glutamine glutaminase family protein [Bdellovibrionota bacterium]
MKNMFFLITFLSLPVLGETLTDKIHSVVEASNDSHIVRFEGGRVGFITNDLLEEMKNNTGAEVQVELDRKSDIRQLTVIKTAPATYDIYLKNNLQEPPAFTPTVITTAKVNEIHNTLNDNFRRLSECSDRAHVWAYDENKKSGINSQKAFIFLTASYINRVRFKWWFHVAPMFDVNTGNGIQKMVTDVMYKDRPVTIKEWTNMMVFSGRDCKMTTKFSEYDVNPQTEDCYMMFESMYYRLPGDLSAQETMSVYRTEWNDFEVSSARSRAFGVGRIQ